MNSTTSSAEPYHETSASAGDVDDDDDENMGLSSLLDDSGSSSSAKAITSNIAQLAKQRLSGDIGTDPAPCIIDLDPSLLPPEEGIDESGDAGQESSDDIANQSTKPEPEIEYSSFKFWQSSFCPIDDSELLSAVQPSLESMSLENPKSIAESKNETVSASSISNAGDTDPNYQKFMERRLGVGSGIAASSGESVEKATLEAATMENHEDEKEHQHQRSTETEISGGSEENVVSAKVHSEQRRQHSDPAGKNFPFSFLLYFS